MVETIIKSVLGVVVSGALGFCISRIRDYKNKIKNKEAEKDSLKVAIMTMIQNTLTSTYYSYEPIKVIPDYIYKNWLNLLDIYEKLGGDDYIHVLAEKMKSWDFEKTDVLI